MPIIAYITNVQVRSKNIFEALGNMVTNELSILLKKGISSRTIFNL